MSSDETVSEADTFVRINCSVLSSDENRQKCDEITEQLESDKIDFYEAVIQLEKEIGSDRIDDVVEEIIDESD